MTGAGRAIRRVAGTIVLGALTLAVVAAIWSGLHGRPQDLPWTPLDLGEAIGLFTGRKLTALGQDFAACRAAMDRAGIHYAVLPPRIGKGRCGYADGVRLTAGGPRAIAFVPAGLGTACPVAAALAAWEWNVVQPAAQHLFGSRVVTIDHLGSYSCRHIRGSTAGWSEHASADAIDISGFRLADGRRITVTLDWRGRGREAAFLHRVRDGACRLFATTLSPDYNTAHHDHLHLDQAARGTTGWRACR